MTVRFSKVKAGVEMQMAQCGELGEWSGSDSVPPNGTSLGNRVLENIIS